jgi:type VI secretion system protein ImpG
VTAVRDDLLYYYERELAYLRRLGAEFAEKYPKIAARLQLEPGKCEDPHVERLLEGFAFLTARVHLKIDDDFPEISEALLNVLYPHYLRPIPAMSLVEFQLDPEQGKVTTGLTIPRDALLYSRPIGGTPCKFSTCYPTTLWPLEVSAARWTTPDQLRPPVRAADASAALRLELACFPDVRFDQLELDTLRVFLHGAGNLVGTLYELLGNNCTAVLVRDPAHTDRPPITLPGSALRPVGFGPDEGMLPFPQRSLTAYRLLQEYFTFPEKFSFFDLTGLEQLRRAGFGQKAEVVFLIGAFERRERAEMLESGVSAATLRLGCTPVINVFPLTAEPVLVTRKAHEYPIIADARRRDGVAVFSVDDVVAVTADSPEPLRFEPMYGYRHATKGTASPALFWYARRKPTVWQTDGGTDVYLSFVDLSGTSARPGYEAVTARVTAYNGDLPSRLPFGDESGDFQLPGGGPIQRIRALVKPTPALPPPQGRPQLWRLISQLSLNYMSLVDGGPEALQELLRLHNFGDTGVAERHIQSIVGLKSEPCYTRIRTDHGLTFARGHRVELTLDEDQFAGGGVYLFASVLERFLGMFTSLNSFSILAARTQQRKEALRTWPPRAGRKALL